MHKAVAHFNHPVAARRQADGLVRPFGQTPVALVKAWFARRERILGIFQSMGGAILLADLLAVSGGVQYITEPPQSGRKRFAQAAGILDQQQPQRTAAKAV